MKNKYYILLVAITWLMEINAQVLTSSDLPIVVVNTTGEIQNEPKMRAQLGIIFNGEGQRNNINDPRNHYNGLAGIEVRGQSSQGFPMKSYDLELWNADSSDRSVSLFGFPAESDFVLYAPYTDKSLMRNFLAYTFTRELGRWAARCRYVELIVNNDYKGIYVFMEKIRRDSGRVNIAKLGRNENSGDAITGGYIVSVDKGPIGWQSTIPPLNAPGNQAIRFTHVYPQADSVTVPQRQYIQRYVDSFEQALMSTRYQDPQVGWRRFANELSFIDYLIVNELSRNVDGYRISTYLHKDKQSRGCKLTMGPVWDYDLAFYNANYCRGSDSSGWAWQFNTTCPNDFYLVPFWWNRFFTDTSFQSNFRCRWLQLRETSLSDTRIHKLIDSIAERTQEARTRHFTRWPILGVYVWPNVQPVPVSYNGEVAQLKNWFTNRIRWIDRNLPFRGGCATLPPTAYKDLTITAYPNPFRTQLIISIKSRQIRSLDLVITDGIGRHLHTEKLFLNLGDNRRSIQVNNWPAGIYFIRVLKGDGSSEVVRVVKQ